MQATDEDRESEHKEAFEPETEVSLSTTPTTRKELWAYYLYLVGNNGLPAWYFGPAQFQNLLHRAGYDPTQAPFTTACNGNGCVLPYLGSVRDVNSIVLLTNGLSCALQAVLFIFLGSWADFGNGRQNVLIFSTILTVGASFGWLVADSPGRWRVGVALYMLGQVATQCSLVFWNAAFVVLARDLPEVQQSASEVKSGQKSREDHDILVSLSRNRIPNISFIVSALGQVVILGTLAGVLKAWKSEYSVENNTKALSALLAILGGICLLCAIPWFIFEKRRPGLLSPSGTNFFLIGFVQVYVAFQECLKLKQTFLYLVFYLLMSDVLSTTTTVIATLQNSIISYSSFKSTLLLIVAMTAHGVGMGAYWFIHKRFQIKTKTMLAFNAFCVIVLTAWGLIGVWSDRFGFKHVWEIWAYQIFHGLTINPWYTYSQTMLSEVAPAPQMCLFFALFSVVGRTSAFIGPFVSSAIITASHSNHNMPFAFLFGLGVFSTIFLWMVDVGKSRVECDEFLAAEGARNGFADAPVF